MNTTTSHTIPSRETEKICPTRINIKFEDDAPRVRRAKILDPLSAFVSSSPNYLDPTSTITIDKLLHESHYTVVYHGTTTLDESLVEVAVKFARNLDLSKEEGIYTGCCKSLQGEVVPRFHGLYHLETNKAISCSIMEYWGKALDRAFSEYPRQEQ